MIPNEYLFFHYFSSDTVDAIRSGLESRGEFLLAPAGELLRRERPHAGRGARGLARDAPRARGELLRRGPRGGRRAGRERAEEDVGGYEGQAIALVEAIAVQRAPRADPEHRQPQQPAVPRRARRRRGAVHRRPAGVVPFAVGDVPDHARALIEAIKAVERTTIEAARPARASWP